MENTQENDADSNAIEVYTHKETQEEEQKEIKKICLQHQHLHIQRRKHKKNKLTCILLKMFQYKKLMQYPGK